MSETIHAIVLASGFSRRLEGFNKLMLPCPHGKVLVEFALSAAANTAGIDSKLLIYSEETVGTLSTKYGFTAVYNATHTEGKAAGIRLAALTAPEGGLLFFAGDQPITDSHLPEKILAQAKRDTACAVFTRTKTGYGLPAFFSKKLRPYLAQLIGEQGGKDAIKQYEAVYGKTKTAFVDADVAQSADIDTWNDYCDFLAGTNTRHIFITGERGSGKSTLAKKIIQTIAQKTHTVIDGISTHVRRDESDTENYVYIERIATKEKMQAARLLKRDKTLIAFNRTAFEEFAVNQLEMAVVSGEKNNTPILIDELGRLEAECGAFHRTVKNLLDNKKTRTLIVLQSGDIAFNRELLSRNDAVLFQLPCITQ